jgi:hypothetical protein
MRQGSWPVLAVAFLLSGCQKSGGSSACLLQYSGNYAGAVSEAAGCATVAPATTASAGTWVLAFNSTHAVTGGVDLGLVINLGAFPATGLYTSETIGGWQAVGSTLQTCRYSGGTMSIPGGNMTLNLASIPPPSGPGASPGSGVAHGTVHVEQFVQAPSGVNCGPGDIESFDLAF